MITLKARQFIFPQLSQCFIQKMKNVNVVVNQFLLSANNQLYMKPNATIHRLCVLSCLIYLALNGITLPSSDIFVPTNNQMFHTYAFTAAGGNQYAKFIATFPATYDVGQVLMIVKTTNTPPTTDQIKLSYYQHLSPTTSTAYDLERANTGNTQVVEILVGTSSTTVYVYMINFNRYDGLSYSIAVSQHASRSTGYCASGNTQSVASIYCSSCANTQYVGAFCNILNQRMSETITYTLTLYGYGDSRGNFGTFTIPGSSSIITLYFKASSTNVYNFIQFKERSDQVAGLLNYATNGGFNTVNIANTQYRISISSSGTDTSVSFLNLNTAQTSINIWYTVDSSSSILLIVLAALGAILFIGLIIVAVCIVKRMRTSSQLVHPRLAAVGNTSLIRPSQNNLTAQEIEMYFPSVLCKHVFRQEEASSNNLMNNNNNSVDRDCVICLCAVGLNDMMKVTYCNHIFHAHCLVEWFKKNRNCPYCREQFNKKATLEHYQALLKSSRKNMLMGVELANQIVHSKQMKSSIVVQQIKG